MAASTRTEPAAARVLGPRILLLLSVLALSLIGFVMIYSASSVTAITGAETLDQAQPMAGVLDQLKYAVVGVGCVVALWLIPYGMWRTRLVWLVWGAAIVLLLLTAAMGSTAYGAQRWLYLGPVSIQPSEFAKIALILMMARLLDRLRNREIGWRDFIIGVVVFVGLPVVLIYTTQSDLGTTAICFIGIIAVLWLGEIERRYVLLILGIGLVVGILAIALVGYRADRFVYLNPWDDGQGGKGDGFQMLHSYFAFAQGGLFGVGLGNSREKFSYLPMADNDFVFAIVGEELGMVGALAVIALFLLLLYAALRIARQAPDNFGCMMAGGCAIMLVFQAFLNIGCVIGVFPTTGKPLPFISSGGSSLVATFIMVGLILSVSKPSGARTVYDRRRDNLRVVRAAGQGRR